ncbi:hypothetical protein PAECIP112173_03298 [Paenibacillus sp. JJ-100]|uniref:hypothetical protein n=1 Tax=Paenibacillus sp. JJ-100 TaxID=2974896 RepID=UPI0022FF99CA|nr:hypothetical protein [Paenibacillus sp. JJ-100]CAI6081709.1 hypothetical protein PAECIP112173_03298 [Paenibacillus sp. JJ-100]
MMTLLKYDFRRNWNTLLAGLVILMIIQLVQTILMSPVTGSLLGIMAYIGAGVAIFVKVIRTYTANIRSYNRRLIPVTGLSHVLSPIIFGFLCGLGLLLLGLIHGYLYITMKLGMNLSTYLDIPNINIANIISTLLFTGWIVLFMTIIIFFSISVAGTFRWKTGPWIGIATFFIVTYLLSWLENMIFAGKFSPSDLFQFTEESTGISFTSSGVIWTDGRWVSTAFEIAIAVLLMWAMVYMNNKKVEV